MKLAKPKEIHIISILRHLSYTYFSTRQQSNWNHRRSHVTPMADRIPQALVKRVQQANHKHHHGTAGTALLMASKSGKSYSEFIHFVFSIFSCTAHILETKSCLGFHGHLTGNYSYEKNPMVINPFLGEPNVWPF